MTQQERRLNMALRRLRPDIRRAFEQAISDAAISIDRRLLAELIEAGRVTESVELLRVDQSLFSPLRDAVRDAYRAGGLLVEDIAPRGMGGVFRFDGNHAGALAWVQQYSASLVQGITAEGIETARRVIAEGIEEGLSSRVIARSLTGKRVGRRNVGGFLGLTAQQADSIITGRAKLASGNPALMREYLTLKLRDARFDKKIAKAAREGRPITGRDLDAIMEAHRAKALTYRGNVIARHESANALAAGQDEAYRQIAERPDVERVTVRWQHNLSENPRIEHQMMDGTVIEQGETFDFPDGVRMQYPHDVSAPPEHTIGCRCVAIYRVRLRRG